MLYYISFFFPSYLAWRLESVLESTLLKELKQVPPFYSEDPVPAAELLEILMKLFFEKRPL